MTRGVEVTTSIRQELWGVSIVLWIDDSIHIGYRTAHSSSSRFGIVKFDIYWHDGINRNTTISDWQSDTPERPMLALVRKWPESWSCVWLKWRWFINLVWRAWECSVSLTETDMVDRLEIERRYWMKVSVDHHIKWPESTCPECCLGTRLHYILTVTYLHSLQVLPTTPCLWRHQSTIILSSNYRAA